MKKDCKHEYPWTSGPYRRKGFKKLQYLKSCCGLKWWENEDKFGPEHLEKNAINLYPILCEGTCFGNQ